MMRPSTLDMLILGCNDKWQMLLKIITAAVMKKVSMQHFVGDGEGPSISTVKMKSAKT